jgi:serine/threonine-protein kinase
MRRAFTPERWRRLEPLLDDALDLAPDARPAYLDRVCAGDAGLRADLESLLAADSAAGAFLEGSAGSYFGELLPSGGQPSGGASPAAPGLPAGTRVGPYRIERELARGGMGAVYLAERADAQFEQRVALKLVRPGLDSAEVHARFVAERQILARLGHPHIARLLDGGLTDDGRPWFAMEYVEGAPLVAWCNERQLAVSDRLDLFAHVCDAVRFAHQSLVVHRDLKPSNILVTAAGEVKLLDFGIAKVLGDGADGASDSPATRTQLRILTPEYAAPEQVRGEPVTTATDVYALGCVLYELLTGRRAHRFERHTPAEVERVVCDTEPQPPSVAAAAEGEPASTARGTRPDRLRRTLRGDLDTIVLTALRKEPTRRYSSAEALLEDVRRYRGGLPIRARPDALGYRLGKFVRRHVLGVTASAALALALLGGIVGTLWQARAARLEAARVRTVQDFLISLFEGATPQEALGREITARELLTRGVRKVDSALAGQPALQQELLGLLGKIYRDLGLYPEADSLLRRAVIVARQAYGHAHPEVAGRLTDLGSILKIRGDHQAADSLLSDALALARRVRRSSDPALAVTLVELASVRSHLGNAASAESLYREALAIDVRHYGPEHLEVATDLDNLGVMLSEVKDDVDGADSAYRAALAIRRRHLAPGHPSMLNTLGNLSSSLIDQGRYAEAEPLKREVLAGNQRLFPNGHPDVAYALHGLANVLEHTGNWGSAESLYVEALTMRRRLLGDDHPMTMATLNNLAIVRYRMGDAVKAALSFREAATVWARKLGPRHTNTLTAQANLGVVLSDAGQHAEAERVLRIVLAERRRQSGDGSVNVAVIHRNLGIVLRRRGRLAEAEQLLRAALTAYRAQLDARHPRIAEVLTALGEVLNDDGRGAAAEPLLREALDIRVEKLDAVDVRIAETRMALGVAVRALGSGRRAEGDSLLHLSCAAFAASPWAARQLAECRRLTR